MAVHDGELDFFERLSAFEHFADVADPTLYVSAPESWVLVVTDVRNSTRAIAEGRYKEVNLVGAASIACAVNTFGTPRLPYVFGGDGALLLIPPARLGRVTAALNRLAWLAQDELGLSLRAAAVSVEELVRRGFDVRVAKYALSADVHLAMFAGRGVDEAVRLAKDEATEARYSLVKDRPPSTHAPVRGLHCRWEPLDNRNGEIAAIIVKAADPSYAKQAEVYRAFLGLLESVCGDLDTRPVSEESLHLAADPASFAPEATLHAGRRDGLSHRLRVAAIGLVNRMGRTLIRRRRKLGGFDGARYPAAVVANSDFRKFDGALRMVLDLSPGQRARIEHYLEEHFRANELVYGLAVSQTALMTCLVYDRQRDHVHFVDGADGGYTEAARQLRERARHLPLGGLEVGVLR